ncbi:Hypothetical_protein [Hexamita inflata]|uniref:Hypothetical_protein n=1 Tax=Hexamita inflata TaxID=28002 RepID=A0AA86Q387_9EUKA|nr:Hypothetical protein HINF_LOCUS33265 [Hexamita inflata]
MDIRYLNIQDVTNEGEHDIKGYIQKIFSKNNRYYFKISDLVTGMTMQCCLHARQYNSSTIQKIYSLQGNKVYINDVVTKFSTFQPKYEEQEHNQQQLQCSEFMAFVDPHEITIINNFE